MLAVIDDELGLHRHLEHAELVLAWDRLELDFGIDGYGEGGENVIVRVVENIAGDFRNSGLVEDALGTEFGGQVLLIENGDSLHHTQGPHGDVVLPPGLDAADDWERKGGFGVHGVR